MTFTQCYLVTGQHRAQVSWIPSPFAIVGKVLRLKNRRSEWEDGWVVQATYGVIAEETLVKFNTFANNAVYVHEELGVGR